MIPYAKVKYQSGHDKVFLLIKILKKISLKLVGFCLFFKSKQIYLVKFISCHNKIGHKILCQPLLPTKLHFFNAKLSKFFDRQGLNSGKLQRKVSGQFEVKIFFLKIRLVFYMYFLASRWKISFRRHQQALKPPPLENFALEKCNFGGRKGPQSFLGPILIRRLLFQERRFCLL